MRENSFLERAWVDYRASDVQSGKDVTEILTARTTDNMKDVISILKKHNISQLPVVDENDLLVGIVTEIDLLNHMLLTDHVHEPDETIESIVDPNVPVVRPNTPLETLMAIFSNRNVVVIAVDGKIKGILTKIDILDFVSSQIWYEIELILY